MNAAIKADAIDLVEALVAQRESLRRQLPEYQVVVFDQIVTNMIDRRRGRLYSTQRAGAVEAAVKARKAEVDVVNVRSEVASSFRKVRGWTASISGKRTGKRKEDRKVL